MQRIEHFLAEMRERNVRRSWLATPWVRMLWKVRIPAPPPIMLGWWRIALSDGLFFGVGMWVLMRYVGPETWGNTFDPWIAISMSALFGAGMASMWRARARMLGLPRWKDYPPPPDASVRSMSTDDEPFAEHPDGQFDNVVAAMTDATRRLEALPEWARWIDLDVQGMGSHEDAYRYVEVKLRGEQIDFSPNEIDELAALKSAGLTSDRIDVRRAGSIVTLAGATPGERAAFMDAAFRTQLGVRGWPDQDDDYAVGFEW